MRARPSAKNFFPLSIDLPLRIGFGLGIAAAAFAATAAQAQNLAAGLDQALPAITAPAPPTTPRPDPFGTLNFQVENDLWGGTDRYYTNGVMLSWRSPSEELPAPLAWLDRQLDFAQGPGRLRWGLSVGHSLYTPVDTQASNPDPKDRPYAGLLYATASINRVTARTLSSLELQVGMIGPSALGKSVQNDYHHIIGVESSKGWDHQLEDEPVAALILERKWRMPLLMIGDTEIEALPTLSVSLGNLQTYAAGGGLLRWGQNLESDFGPPRIRPALAGSNFFQPADDSFGWYVFGGAEGRGVARDITLDGNTWRDSPSVNKRAFVADMQVGAAVIWKGVRLAYTQVWRTEEFYGQTGGMQKFGAVSVSFRF